MTILDFFHKRRAGGSASKVPDTVNDPHSERTQLVQGEDQHELPETEKRVFFLAVLAVLLSTGALMLAGLKRPEHLASQIVVVDVNQLLRLKAADLLKEKGFDPQDDKRDLKIAEQARAIRSLIEKYASDRGVIVVAKGAVFGSNMKDVTDDISALL